MVHRNPRLKVTGHSARAIPSCAQRAAGYSDGIADLHHAFGVPCEQLSSSRELLVLGRHRARLGVVRRARAQSLERSKGSAPLLFLCRDHKPPLVLLDLWLYALLAKDAHDLRQRSQAPPRSDDGESS